MSKILKTKSKIIFSLKVIPKSSINYIFLSDDGQIKLKLQSPPVEGKANEACIKFLSKLLGVSKSSVVIKSGQKSKYKTIEVYGDPEKLELALKNIF